MGKYCLTLEIYRNIFPFISLLQYRYILQITKFKKDLACFQAEIKKERESLEITTFPNQNSQLLLDTNIIIYKVLKRIREQGFSAL